MKVLLIIYLISIIYFFIGLILTCAIILRRVREENLKVKKMSVAEKIRSWLRIFLLAVVPILNIIFGTILLFSDDLQNDVMEKLREESAQLHRKL